MKSRPEVSICGARLENPDGTSQLAARRFPTPLGELESAAKFGPITKLLSDWRICPDEPVKPVKCGWTPGAALLFRREVLQTVGIFDEEFFMYFEEVDLCLRAARAGIDCWYVPTARVIHLVGQSSGVTVASGRPKRLPGYWFASRRRYYVKNHGRMTFLWANVALVLGTIIHRTISFLRWRSPSDPPSLIRDLLFRHAS
jgi:N-acetylglucosaminyl-diphospho-decaprenol L-rhamnosyltransferase